MSLLVLASLLSSGYAASNGVTTSYGSLAVTHYPPVASSINDLAFAVNGTGHMGIYNSSTTPNALYGEYNWCNQPHVRTREYDVAPREYKLVYVEVIHRHHKRTPYASNTFPVEDISWDCTGFGPAYGARNPSGPGTDTAFTQWSASWPDVTANPFVQDAQVGFNHSNCQFPAITDQGLVDSIQHGKDLRSLYHDKLHFLPAQLDNKKVRVRVTTNGITSQVASGLIVGLFPGTKDFTVAQQSSTFDSLEPTYSCPAANTIKNSILNASGPWGTHLTAATGVYAALDAVSGIPTNDNGGFHASFDHYYDNLSAKQCHGKPLPCNLSNRSLCVDQSIADAAYRLGNWEYSYQWRDAVNSTLYSALHYGAFMLELVDNLNKAAAKSDGVIYRHNIAHDGSISSLLSFLQIATMVWPGMGSEVVFELYEKKGAHYLRVLWGGRPMVTSTPLGTLEFIPVKAFTDYVLGMVGGSAKNLYAVCHA